ncbi:MAG: hypothetical protein IJ087_04700 [Eggerthellaceae bacterium]|nr:hypothetical protein [Eggerthellaceae bacterium]
MFDRSALTKGKFKRHVFGRDIRRKGSEAPFWMAALVLSVIAALAGWDAACAYMTACTGIGGVAPGAVAIAASGLASYFFALANCYAGLPRALLVPVVGAAAVLACGVVSRAFRGVFAQAMVIAPTAIAVAAVFASLAYLLYKIVKPY